MAFRYWYFRGRPPWEILESFLPKIRRCHSCPILDMEKTRGVKVKVPYKKVLPY